MKLTDLTKVVPSGSYHICTPPVEDTDRDFFAKFSQEVFDYLIDQGFQYNMNDDTYEEDFMSFRKDKINIILVRSGDDLRKIELATELCKLLNTQSKEHRLAVFNTVRYGVVSTSPSNEL